MKGSEVIPRQAGRQDFNLPTLLSGEAWEEAAVDSSARVELDTEHLDDCLERDGAGWQSRGGCGSSSLETPDLCPFGAALKKSWDH